MWSTSIALGAFAAISFLNSAAGTVAPSALVTSVLTVCSLLRHCATHFLEFAADLPAPRPSSRARMRLWDCPVLLLGRWCECRAYGGLHRAGLRNRLSRRCRRLFP